MWYMQNVVYEKIKQIKIKNRNTCEHEGTKLLFLWLSD